MQVCTLEQANESLLEAERQTSSELAQRLVDIASKGQAAAAQLVDQELLQVGGSSAWWVLLCGWSTAGQLLVGRLSVPSREPLHPSWA